MFGRPHFPIFMVAPHFPKADAWVVWSVPTLNSRDPGLLRVDALPTRHFGTRLVHWQGQGIQGITRAEHEVVPLRCEQWRIRLGKYWYTWTQTPNGEMHYVFWMGLPRREMPGDVELRMPWGNYVILYYRIHIGKNTKSFFAARFWSHSCCLYFAWV